MRASLAEGTLVLELGSSFGIAEAQRIRETCEAFAPVKQLTLDFGPVRCWEEPALALLGLALAAHPAMRVLVRGLDHRRQLQLERVAAAEGHR